MDVLRYGNMSGKCGDLEKCALVARYFRVNPFTTMSLMGDRRAGEGDWATGGPARLSRLGVVKQLALLCQDNNEEPCWTSPIVA